MSSYSNNKGGKRNFKIVLLGDSGVGKTALIARYTHNRFEQKQNSTIGIDFVGKNITVNGHSYRLQLWDTAGQQRYRSLIPSYLKDASSVIYVFDITKNDTLMNLQAWVQLYLENKSQKSIMVVCGNKSDILNKVYDENKLKEILSKYGMKYFEVSALTGGNVEDMFNCILEQVQEGQAKKKKKFNDSPNHYQPFSSSQNIHNEEMKSVRSETAKQEYEQPSAFENKQNTQQKLQNVSSIQLQPPGENKMIQGQNRCC